MDVKLNVQPREPKPLLGRLGPEGAKDCLNAGTNDLGGTLMNESITRAAGAVHGQEMPPERMEKTIRNIGRIPRQRTTLYTTPVGKQFKKSYDLFDVRQDSLVQSI
jgi:FO synthase